jgi:hypothetical protein
LEAAILNVKILSWNFHFIHTVLQSRFYEGAAQIQATWMTTNLLIGRLMMTTIILRLNVDQQDLYYEHQLFMNCQLHVAKYFLGNRQSVNWSRNSSFLRYPKGHSMGQMISCQPLTMEAHVHAQIYTWRICGGQRGTGTGFSPNSSVFRSQYHSTMAHHNHIWSEGWTIELLVAAVQRHSLAPSTWTATNPEVRYHNHISPHKVHHMYLCFYEQKS